MLPAMVERRRHDAEALTPVRSLKATFVTSKSTTPGRAEFYPAFWCPMRPPVMDKIYRALTPVARWVLSEIQL